MTQDEVLELFRIQAETLGEVQATQSDIILRFAQLLSEMQWRVPEEKFNEFVSIGAIMYQEALGKFRAKTEISDTMERSLRKS
jgi:hypothetical protein